jgi:hypothetical protein
MVHGPGSTLLQGLYGPLSMSDASSYPVTPLAAFGLSDAFDKWDAINAQNLVSLSRHAHRRLAGRVATFTNSPRAGGG